MSSSAVSVRDLLWDAGQTVNGSFRASDWVTSDAWDEGDEGHEARTGWEEYWKGGVV